MNKILAISCALALSLTGASHVTRAAEVSVEDAAMEALDAFMTAFNARDPKAWAATLHYPHVRIASGTVRVWESAAEAERAMDFDAFARRYGWDHSAWDSRRVVQAGKDKVHIAVQFSRYDGASNKLSTFESLYVVTLVDGTWGTQARSSFAP